LGFAIPMVLLASGLILQDVARPLFAFAGLIVFATGWALKFILVTRAAYNQGFAIQRKQVHGSGITKVAVKPGWSFPSAQAGASDGRAAARPQ
jgi:phenylacetyl-CoA:acceptor oxidoreductase subunit 2